jgi:hypothetical protein
VYIEDRYEAGLVGVFAMPLPRVEVQVNEQIVEEAKEKEETQAADQARPDEAMDAEKEEEDEHMKGEEEEKAAIQPDRDTADEVMEGVQDDPIETAKAMKEVEAEAEADEQDDKIEPLEDNETEGEAKIVIHIVANRYKLSNFW